MAACALAYHFVSIPVHSDTHTILFSVLNELRFYYLYMRECKVFACFYCWTPANNNNFRSLSFGLQCFLHTAARCTCNYAYVFPFACSLLRTMDAEWCDRKQISTAIVVLFDAIERARKWNGGARCMQVRAVAGNAQKKEEERNGNELTWFTYIFHDISRLTVQQHKHNAQQNYSQLRRVQTCEWTKR